METSGSPAVVTRHGRRDFLKKSAGTLLGAVASFGVLRQSRAAEPVNIGGLYPVTGSFAQIGQGCVNAAKLAVQMVNDAGGIKSLGGAKLNLIISDVQSDTTVTRTETDRLINGYKLSAIHGCFASALTLIASEVVERAKVPLLTGSSTDQLNKGRRYTFTPFSRASQFALAQLQMSKLVNSAPKVAVVFENTAFGTATSTGLREQAGAEGVEIVLFEPYSAGLSDASPLINKVKASGANMLFPVSYLNDLILIIRAIRQNGLQVAINGGSGGFVIPDFYKNVGNVAEGLLGVAHWNHDIDANAQAVNAAYQKQFGEFLFEYAGGLVAQTFMIADALERAASPDPQKVREALTTLDVSSGYAAMCPGGKVKFGPDGKNIYAHPVGVQWQHGDLATVFPKEDARAPLMKARVFSTSMVATIAQAVVNGLLIGGIYALVSIGVSLIFGVVKIVNFAQGEFVMIGMYISFFLATNFGIDPLVSLAVSMPTLFVIGVLLQHFLIRRVLALGDMPQIFLTFAVSLLLLNLALLLFTANYRTVETSYSDVAIQIAGVYVALAKLIAFVVAMLLSALLWLFLRTTDLGKAMRAAAQNRDVAMLMGINPDRVFCVAVGVALALAGAAGSLLMPFYPAYPMVGQVFVLMAFVAVVLGTLGNISGALIASLMMGVAESLGIQFVGADSGLIVVFVMLLLTLALRPSGLFGGWTR